VTEPVPQPDADHSELRSQCSKRVLAEAVAAAVVRRFRDLDGAEETLGPAPVVHGFLGISGQQDVHLAESRVHDDTRFVLVGRTVTRRWPDHIEDEVTHPHLVPLRQRAGRVEQRLPARHIHDRAAEHPVLRHDADECLQAAVVVVMPVCDHGSVESAQVAPREGATQHQRIGSCVDQ